ncbi:MAG TPA: GNAT family N-acetyltransferase [Thermoleophilia bacterium]|nr:GNAT family N-acetyltransferase [Thermoleophilia bacterium]
MIVILPTDDLATVKRLAVAAGLDESEREADVALAAWLAVDEETGEPVGGITLERSRGMDTVNWMSVAEPWRRQGIAGRLVEALETEARGRGIARLYLTARIPGFYLDRGYIEVTDPGRTALLLGDCPQCPQYRVTCTPVAMVKELD